jgi:phosphatidylethanolamine-binding protein (PEBP) family uncharacterized protein
MSFALSLYDMTTMNTHWIIWDIAPTETGIPGMIPRGTNPTFPAGSTQKGAFGDMVGYEGPGGTGIPHTYVFELWALNVAKLPAATASQSLNMMHATGLAMYKIASTTLTAQGTRGGL